MSIVLKSGNVSLLEPSGPVQACKGIVLTLPLPLTGILHGDLCIFTIIQNDTKKTGTSEKPNKNCRNPRKKIYSQKLNHYNLPFRDSNPNYQCLKITSCRWRPHPRMHSFTATTHFKSSRSFVSPCVCCMLCRMRQSRILQSMQHTQGDTKERELLKCVVAVKECIRGGECHLQDVIFKH